jgi:hypothetical protein
MEAEAADAAPAGPEAASSAPTSAAPHAAVEAAAAAPAPAPAAAPADAGAAGAAPAPSGAQQQKARGKVEVEDALKYLDEVRGFFVCRGDKRGRSRHSVAGGHRCAAVRHGRARACW